MAIQFFLNGTQIYAETNTSLTEKVGTFCDGVLPLEITNVKNAILPMSSLVIQNGANSWHFVVVSDDVETIDKTNLLYKHNLVVRSKEYKLKKHLLRNNNFTQPAENESKALYNISVYSKSQITNNTEFGYAEFDEESQNFSSKELSLNNRNKIAKATIKVNSKVYLFGSVEGTLTPLTFTDLTKVIKNAHSNGSITVARYDNNQLYGSITTSIGNKTEIVLDTTNYIFSNLTNKTVFKLRLEQGTKLKFNVSDSNVGGFAVINAELVLRTYYYSLLDIVQQIKKQADKYYNGSNNYNIFEITTNANKLAVLSNTIAPEISFTGVDIYSALYQLFSYIDAIPTTDSDGKLTFDYLNNNNQNPITITKSDEKISINDEYYTNKLVANYQNGKQENAIIYPSANRTARVSTRDYGVPGIDSYVFKVPKPIDYIDKVLVGSSFEIETHFIVFVEDSQAGHQERYNYIFSLDSIDITTQVVESQVYQLLDKQQDVYSTYQNIGNCIYYSKGSKEIDLLSTIEIGVSQAEVFRMAINAALNFVYGVPPTYYIYGNEHKISITNTINKYDLQYNVEYHAVYDGRVEQISTTNKYEGETYANQETSSVSLNRMGNNLQGLIAKLGNETENISIGVSSYGSRMRAGSLWVDDDGNRYIANTVKTTFSTSEDNVIVEAEFTKNFNLISQYTKIDQEKRFYEISTAITNKGYDNITEYIYFDYTQPTDFTYKATSLREIAFISIIERTLLNQRQGEYATCDYTTFQAYTLENDQQPAYENYIYIPSHIYGSGNSLCFEMDFDNSINAGDRLTGSSNLYTRTTLYTEKTGFADRVKIEARCSTESGYFGENFPIIPSVIATVDDLLFSIDYNYYKKPNEIFHLNYELAFISGNNCQFFFGDRFIEQNGIIRNSQLSTSIKLYKSNGQYSIIDNKILDDSVEVQISNISYSITTTPSPNVRKYMTMTITTTSTFSCNSWALADEKGNVLIASNKVISTNNQITIYIIPRRNRI